MMRLVVRPGDKEKITDRISEQMHKIILDKGMEYTDAWTEGTTWVLGLIAELTESDAQSEQELNSIKWSTPPGVKGVIH